MHLADALIQRNLQNQNKKQFVNEPTIFTIYNVLLSQVTFTIEIVSKQLHNNEQESSRINVDLTRKKKKKP